MEIIKEAPKDTAKKIRAILKIKFQGTKFGVTTSHFAGGSSVDIFWTDGPSKEDVSKITKPFAGVSRIGITDDMMPQTREEDGKLIRSDAEFVMVHRFESKEA